MFAPDYQPRVWPNDFETHIPWKHRFPRVAGKIAAFPAQFLSVVKVGSPPFPFVIADEIRWKFARFSLGLYQWDETLTFAGPDIKTTLVCNVVQFPGGNGTAFWNFVFAHRNPFLLESRRVGIPLGPIGFTPPWPQHQGFGLDLFFRGETTRSMGLELIPKNGYFQRNCK